MLEIVASTVFSFAPSAVYYRGLHDRESSEFDYKSRNQKKSVPEVTKCGNGEVYPLTETIEWLWYWAWAWRYPSLVSSGKSLRIWKTNMRGNGAFTNKKGSDTCHSWILKTNIVKEPMRSEGVTCPGENIFRIVDKKIINVGERESLRIWCLDYDYLKTLGVVEAKNLAIILPPWLLHVAQNVHPDGSSSPWDYNFRVPLFSASGETAIIDGFHCRTNSMRVCRLTRDAIIAKTDWGR